MIVQHQCPRFHIYHAPEGDDRGCPVCAAQQGELAKTRGVWSDLAPLPDPAPAAEASAPPTSMPQPAPPSVPGKTDPGAAPASFDPGATAVPGHRTVGVYAHLGAQVEPVVGWLACVDGPDKGRDWRLVSGRNPIGRGEGMAVRLGGDTGVSRSRHAVVSFDPRRGGFTLAPGDGAALVYCNGHEVAMPVQLAPFDRIELGRSTLVFVPLVGERFVWGG